MTKQGQAAWIIIIAVITLFALAFSLPDITHQPTEPKKLERKVKLGDRRIKIFSGNKRSEVGERVNLWLRDNPGFEVKNIDTELSRSTSYNLLITVYYQEGS